MAKLSRRQILLAGFAIGAGISIATSRFRSQQTQNESDEDANVAYDTELSASQVSEIEKSVQLKQPTISYDRQMSKFLVRCCRLATEQYLKGTTEANYDGLIASLASYFPQLNEYEQVTSFLILRERFFFEPIIERIGLEDLIPKTDLIYGGFILKSSAKNIIVIRGTQELDEWVANLNVKQIYYQIDNPEAGKVHNGFHDLHFFAGGPLKDKRIRTVLEQLDPNIPCYITGHSLGGAMAILMAIDLALNFEDLRPQLRIYCYGTPRVGDPTFARFYSDLVPNTYRIVNQADSTWLLPPIQLKDSVYLHLGQTWSFIYQTKDLNLNHQLASYQAAIDREVEKPELPSEPISGF